MATVDYYPNGSVNIPGYAGTAYQTYSTSSSTAGTTNTWVDSSSSTTDLTSTWDTLSSSSGTSTSDWLLHNSTPPFQANFDNGTLAGPDQYHFNQQRISELEEQVKELQERLDNSIEVKKIKPVKKAGRILDLE